MELSAVDVFYVKKELALMRGARIEKIFQSKANKKDLLFVMHHKDLPKIHLRFQLPGMVGLQKAKPSYPQTPPGFAVFLRKYLKGGKILSTWESGFDRTLMLTITSQRKQYDLMVELVSPGNMILVEQKKIKSPLETQRHKDRTIRGGVEYEPLPPQFDTSVANEEELIEKLTSSKKDSVVTALAIELGLGGVYAEEACARAKVEKDAKIDAINVKKLAKAVVGLFKEKIVPYVDEKRAYPFKLVSKKTKKSEKFFLEALGLFIPDPKDGEVQDQGEGKKKKTEKIVVAQEKRLVELEKKSVEDQKRGEKIFENYQLVEKVIKLMKEDKEKLKKMKEVKKIHKNGTVELEL